MKIRPDQEKKWEEMWEKWKKPLPQDSNDDIFADMKAAVPNWEELVKKEFHGVLGAIDSSEFENAIETVLDGEDPKSKKKFWDNCVTFDRFIDTVRYVVQNDYHKFNESEKVEESFDQLDWKNGSLTGNGLKQAVDMFKAQDADKQTVVIYDRKSGKTFNIVDVSMGNMNSGHGLEIDIDTSKAIQKESESMKDNKKINEEQNDLHKEYVSVSEMLEELQNAKLKNKEDGMHAEIFALVNGRLELMTMAKFMKAVDITEDTGRFILFDDSNASKEAYKKIKKIYHLGEDEVNEADDNDLLSHALDVVGVKASTANSKAQDEVQMTATDGDTYAGIDVAIDRDIDAAMEKIYK